MVPWPWCWAWLLCASLAVSSAFGAGPTVSNVRLNHRVGTLDVEIRYDLAGDESQEYWIVVGVSPGQGEEFVEGTTRLKGTATPVRAGAGRTVVWNPPAAWLGQTHREVRVRIEAFATVPGMVRIPPGKFAMGSPESEVERDADEGPTTEVSISRGYWLGRYEVTQKEWESVMGNNPSLFRGDPNLPVENVNWEEAMEYCRRLTQREREAGRLPKGYEYRLPTEAEWEYACRAGTRTATAFGERLDSTQANFDGNHPYNGAAKRPSIGQPVKVGSYPANEWGLHDMHGNVWEWCLDWYVGRLPGGAVTTATGPKMGSVRVYRGGSWYFNGRGCRSACRGRGSPSFRVSLLGFRAACAPVLP